MLSQFSETTSINSQMTYIDEMTRKYFERNPIIGDNPVQDGIRFQYRLARELKKSCPAYLSDQIRLIPKSVLDLENKLTKQQIDSLDLLLLQIKQEKKVHLYIVTIDSFYPDSTIERFSNRYREFWAPRLIQERGVILVIFSTSLKQLRISTGEISMKYLTDDECSEVNKVILSYFRNDNYFYGLVEGILSIKARL